MNLAYVEIDYPYELIHERDSYEETLEFVRKIDPLLVIPGSERGVVLANKLAYDLDLLGNPIANIEAMTLKHKMQKKIARAGLRHIRGKRISSIEEAVNYFEVKPFDKVVLKPVYDSNSSNVCICSNKEEIIENVEKLLTKKDMFGKDITERLIRAHRVRAKLRLLFFYIGVGHHAHRHEHTDVAALAKRSPSTGKLPVDLNADPRCMLFEVGQASIPFPQHVQLYGVPLEFPCSRVDGMVFNAPAMGIVLDHGGNVVNKTKVFFSRKIFLIRFRHFFSFPRHHPGERKTS